MRLHVAIADQLEREPDWYDGDATELASELVCHWTSAHDQRRALPATLEAARSAEQMYAYPEALQHTEAALALWGQVADAPALTGLSHVRLLRHAGDIAADVGPLRPRALRTSARPSTKSTPRPIRSKPALVHERLGRFLWQVNRPADEYLVENFKAVELIPPDAADGRAGARARHARAAAHARGPEHGVDRHLLAGHRCRAAAGRARIEEGHARNTLGTSLSGIGRFEDGRAELERSRATSRSRPGSWDDVAACGREPRRQPAVLRAVGSRAATRRSKARRSRAATGSTARAAGSCASTPPSRSTSSAAGTRWRSRSAKRTRSTSRASTACGRGSAYATCVRGARSLRRRARAPRARPRARVRRTTTRRGCSSTR